MTDLSIITVSYRGWERLRKSLDALTSFNGTAFNFELIIVDNNSGDGILDELEKEYPSARFIRNNVNGGFSNGCNLGASHASGEYLLFLNPDTVAGPEALSRMLAVMRTVSSISILSCRQTNEKGRECVVAGKFPALRNLTGFLRILDFSGTVRKNGTHNTTLKGSGVSSSSGIPGPGLQRDTYDPGMAPGKAPGTSADCDMISYPDWVSGSVIMMRRQQFLSMDGFDEDFWMYYEDVDICRRVSDAGGTVALLHDAVIEHNHGGSSRINPATASLTKTEVHISRHVYISKHMGGLRRLLVQCFLVTNNILTNLVTAAAGLLFFFLPRMWLRVLIFINLLHYYSLSMSSRSWISPRSVSRKSVKKH